MVSHDVLHGSCVVVASTVPSTTNCSRAIGPIVWARQSTTPPTVEPSTTVCETTFAAGRGLGFFGFGFGFGLRLRDRARVVGAVRDDERQRPPGDASVERNRGQRDPVTPVRDAM